MICPKCGAENQEGSSFCNKCGTRLNEMINDALEDNKMKQSICEENEGNKEQDKGVLKERETAKNNIEKNMKELRNPPKDYEEAYKLFVDLYSLYGQIYSQAMSPQGSLMTYNQDINQKSSEFSQIYDKIKVLEPDIETKAKKK
ncbi:Double zinc ribbon [Clostridium liquoris]|jgi:hypothetical protein|uniref:Double zinc ribbon n=1 Tax=Clostridium liquoris TaxID=1289519 RepID=A0A2T0BA61_9CLOT|nr:zinc ribbon domain-containing protein [Clostridium liquoris]PRR80687.1 Double zinc ribbon [Clostridium liquoris]